MLDSELEIIPLPYMRKQRVSMVGNNTLDKPSRRGKQAVLHNSDSSLCWIKRLCTPFDPDGDLATQRAPEPSSQEVKEAGPKASKEVAKASTSEVSDEGLVVAPAALPVSNDIIGEPMPILC